MHARLLLLAVGALAPLRQTAAPGDGDGGTLFEREVLPILEDRCIRCHGESKQKSDLRLDSWSRVLRGAHSGAEPVVVPGDRAASELWRRVASSDEDERMPPKGQPLSADQLERIGHWIDQGAPGTPDGGERDPARDHWAWQTPRRPATPAVERGDWPLNEIDAFVLARLEAEALVPSPQADRATLLRRASLDLTGLPPDLEQLDRFLADTRPDAWERAVDELLASPHFGEQQARRWLDLARYADTNGYEKDQRRTMWRWRDWVIEAFNRDLPYDRFTLLQLAGDLLPDATLEDRLATGFHRNTMVNLEGGVDPEEFRVAAVVDRVNTTGTVWLGATLACAQCHDHKYDPFSQEEYYQLFAFFNQDADDGRNLAPTIPAPRAADEAQLQELRAALASVDEELKADWDGDPALQEAWEREQLALLEAAPIWTPIESPAAKSDGPSRLERLEDGSWLASGESAQGEVYTVRLRPQAGTLTALALETLGHESLPLGGPGRSGDGNFVLGRIELARGDGSELELEAGVADFEQAGGFRAARCLPRPENVEPRRTGWAVGGRSSPEQRAVFTLAQPFETDGREELVLRLRFDFSAEHHLGRFRLAGTDSPGLRQRLEPPRLTSWRAVGPFPSASYAEALAARHGPELELAQGEPFSAAYGEGDGTLAWREEPGWVDGRTHAFDPSHSSSVYLTRALTLERPRDLTLWLGSDDGLRLWVDGELSALGDTGRPVALDQDRARVELGAGEHRLLLKIVNGGGDMGFFFDVDPRSGREPAPEVLAALKTHTTQRTPEQLELLRTEYRTQVSARGRALARDRADAAEDLAGFEAALPTALVMARRAEPRETFVHVRGSFLQPGPKVEAGVPSVLPPLADDGTRDRLALARWLVDPAHPLTARVAVNRQWEGLFGRGLVETSDDLGTRGEPPSHPALLDWLAVEFVEGGWSVKALLRTILTSATYRQSSRAEPLALERDPYNQLLTRGPRFRLPAESVRDVVLAISGLLDPRLGGPSVFPVQPEGIWAAAYSAETWVDDLDGDRTRRGLYTFWRRTAPYPTFLLFDATSRELTCSRRSRTNTPLQALALLNDPAFVEAASGLARRLLRERGDSDEERVARGFRRCTSRLPTEGELATLLELLEAEREHFASAPEDAAALAAPPAYGGGPLAPEVAPPDAELAAWTVVANVLLNLDETITKG